MRYEEYRKLRDDRGMTDSDVAKQTGIPRSMFSDWKAGRYEPKQDKLQKLADFSTSRSRHSPGLNTTLMRRRRRLPSGSGQIIR